MPKKTAKRSLKTKILAFRMNPRFRYGIELIKNKRLLDASGAIEYALQKVLDDPKEGVIKEFQQYVSLAEVLDRTWSDDEAERLASLAEQFPQLLGEPEKIMWQKINAAGELWDNGRLNMNKLKKAWKGLEALPPVVFEVPDDEPDPLGMKPGV